MDDLRIAVATPDDADALIALQRLAFQPEAERYGDPGIPPMVETPAQLRACLAGQTILKAERAGRLVGSVRGRLGDAGTCHIGRLATHPDLQGRGIGAALMRAIEARIPQARRFELFTGHLSVRTIRLYERLGYREFTRAPESALVERVYMEKVP
jgi:ribosomal protein S18 acetylase RimI-like enzyme